MPSSHNTNAASTYFFGNLYSVICKGPKSTFYCESAYKDHECSFKKDDHIRGYPFCNHFYFYFVTVVFFFFDKGTASSPSPILSHWINQKVHILKEKKPKHQYDIAIQQKFLPKVSTQPMKIVVVMSSLPMHSHHNLYHRKFR